MHVAKIFLCDFKNNENVIKLLKKEGVESQVDSMQFSITHFDYRCSLIALAKLPVVRPKTYFL